MHWFIPTAVAIVTALACGQKQPSPGPSTPGASEVAPGVPEGPPERTAPDPASPASPMPRESLADVGLDAAAMDRQADPCDDFYRYACGGWLDTTRIPPGRARYNRFDELRDRRDEVLRRILERARKAHRAKTSSRSVAMLGGFYDACMDESAVAKDGLKGVAGPLEAAGASKKVEDLPAALAALHSRGIWPVFRFSAEADLRGSGTTILLIDSAGFGLPDRDDYVKDAAENKKARRLYRDHLQRMFQHAGLKKSARRAAADVLRLETQLARFTKTAVQRRAIRGMYNPVDPDQLARLAPRFDWTRYFNALGFENPRAIQLTTPELIAGFNSLLRSMSARTWRHYLKWHVLREMAPALPPAFAGEISRLRGELSGARDVRPRWKHCLAATERIMGELVAGFYVAETSANEDKKSAQNMVIALRQALATQIAELSWLSAQSKKLALAKLDRMSHLVGFPATWTQPDFAIDRKSLARSELAGRAFAIRRQLARVGQPYDRSAWPIAPHTVNAIYDPVANRAVFPAGLLQPPFFAARNRLAVNLGALGVLVGHELSHGFDDIGSQFDSDGKLQSWWQERDLERFKDQAGCLAQAVTTAAAGELIADLAGLKLAIRAHRTLSQRGTGARGSAGVFSDEQQLFVAFGQMWCSKSRESGDDQETWSPRRRVHSVLENTPEFAAAFNCAAGTRMRPAQVCKIW